MRTGKICIFPKDIRRICFQGFFHIFFLANFLKKKFVSTFQFAKLHDRFHIRKIEKSGRFDLFKMQKI